MNIDPTDAVEVPDHSLNDDDPQLAQVAMTGPVLSPWDEWLNVRGSGTVTFDDIVIGRVEHDPDDAPRLVLNLGWLKAAGMGLTVQIDPDVDSARSGFVLQRPAPGAAPEPF